MADSKQGSLDKLTSALLRSYRSETRTQRIGAESLPGRDAIVRILDELRQLLFPGFFGRL